MSEESSLSFEYSGGATKDIISYLTTLDTETLMELYQDEFTSLTVFRSLRGLAKQYVMNLALIRASIPMPMLSKWARPQSESHHKAAIHKLFALKLLQITATNDGTKHVYLQQSFQTCVQRVVLGRSSSDDLSLSGLIPSPNPPSLNDLNTHAKSSWENILNTLVGATTKQSGAIATLLGTVGLMRPITPEKNARLEITAAGFKFLFQDIHTQIWQLIIGYLSGAEKRKLNRKQVLTFLFRLSFLTAEKEYSQNNLTPTQKVLLQDLTSFGLIYSRKKKSKRFYPTYLAKYLSTGHSLTKLERESQGFIVAETTFKVYAYTSSQLQIRLISKFTRIEYQLPNMVSGKITKHSIMEAIAKGIPVDLIIDYLEQYAHPLMRQKYPILPINVVDQMRLWESENKRLKMQSASIIWSLPSADVFDEYISVVTTRKEDERSSALAEIGAPDAVQRIVRSVDAYVSRYACQTVSQSGSDQPSAPNTIEYLLDAILTPEIESLDLLHGAGEALLLSRYRMIFRKYGYDSAAHNFTRKLNVNDVIALSDELAAVHIANNALNQSNLLYSSKSDRVIVVTPVGKRILREYKQMKATQRPVDP